MGFLVQVSTAAPTPKMVKPAADRFEHLRGLVFDRAGFDFLAKCGDVFRPADFISDKSGVANRSWHKTGRAFDYDQTCPNLLLISEPRDGRQYFRTFLRCADQSGKLGERKTLHDYRGVSYTGFVFDFTAAAEAIGFKRIPAWNGWEKPKNYNLREFWHYQFDQGLTWAAAMAMLSRDLTGKDAGAGSHSKNIVIGLNDRDANTGGLVTKIQSALVLASLLSVSAIDGVFGAHTRNAVAAFQRMHKLAADGLVGPDTFEVLKLQL